MDIPSMTLARFDENHPKETFRTMCGFITVALFFPNALPMAHIDKRRKTVSVGIYNLAEPLQLDELGHIKGKQACPQLIGKTFTYPLHDRNKFAPMFYSEAWESAANAIMLQEHGETLYDVLLKNFKSKVKSKDESKSDENGPLKLD